MEAIKSENDPSLDGGEGHIDIGARDARQGARTGNMRRVLSVSLTLAVIAIAGVWLWAYRPPHAAPKSPQTHVLQPDMTLPSSVKPS